MLGGYWMEAGQNMTTATEKQIKMHEALFNKHANDLNIENKEKALAFLDYSKARIYHKLKRYHDAKRFYLTALKSPRVDIKMKAIAGFTLSLINK